LARGEQHAPSPPALGAPRPLRLVKAPAAEHPLPQGERAGDFVPSERAEDLEDSERVDGRLPQAGGELPL